MLIPHPPHVRVLLAFYAGLAAPIVPFALKRREKKKKERESELRVDTQLKEVKEPQDKTQADNNNWIYSAAVII